MIAFPIPGDVPLSARLYPAAADRTHEALLILAHGAGAGQSHPFMVRYATALAERGLDVVTFNFPYMDAGRSAPDKAPVLEEAFRRATLAAVRQSRLHGAQPRVFIGGKSLGGRMATHLAAAPELWPADVPPLSGVIVFGYPLNPPGGGRRAQDRVSHLTRLSAPALIVQGTRDTFGSPADIHKALEGRPLAAPIDVHPVPTGDHSLSVLKSVKRSQADVDAGISDTVVAWTAGLT